MRKKCETMEKEERLKEEKNKRLFCNQISNLNTLQQINLTSSSKKMEEEERREAALETTAALQPDFKSQHITPDQLNKFKELHRRRLQIKAGSKIHKNSKGNARPAKGRDKDLSPKKIKDKHSSAELEDSEPSITKGNAMDSSILQPDISAASIGKKKRQKLHWGLDTKERWERKSNM